MSFCYSFQWSAPPQDSDESTCATCTLVRSIFAAKVQVGIRETRLYLPSSLWHFAIAILDDIFVSLICIACKNDLASMSCLLASCREAIGTIAPCCQFTPTGIASHHDSEESIDATCTSPRLDCTCSGSGRDLTHPPLPSSVTIMTTQIAEEDAMMTWASDAASDNSSKESLPLNSINSP